MTKSFRGSFSFSFSFIVMAVLIFILISFVMSADVSTSANEDLSFGWLDLHRHGLVWSVEHFRFGVLVLAIGVAVASTWILSWVLHRRRA